MLRATAPRKRMQSYARVAIRLSVKHPLTPTQTNILKLRFLIFQPQKHLHHFRIEMYAALLAEVVAHLFLFPATTIGTIGSQRIPYIGDGEDAPPKG